MADSGGSVWITAGAALAGVLIGSALAFVKDLLLSGRQRQTDVVYLAVIVGAELERFVKRCLDVGRDDGMSEGQPASGDGRYWAQVKAPVFAPIDMQVQWQSLDATLLDEILGLPDRVEELNEYLYLAHEHGLDDSKDFIWDRQERYAKLGLEVIQLRDRLRKHAKLKARARVEDEVNLARALAECIESVNEERVQHQVVFLEKRALRAQKRMVSEKNRV